MNQKTLNDVAQERFKELKKKLHLKELASVFPDNKQELIRNEISMTNNIDTSIKRLEEEIVYSPKVSEEMKIDADKKLRFVDDTFSFIESLELPPKLSLAIGLIISGYKTNNKQDIANAVVALGEYCNDK